MLRFIFKKYYYLTFIQFSCNILPITIPSMLKFSKKSIFCESTFIIMLRPQNHTQLKILFMFFFLYTIHKGCFKLFDTNTKADKLDFNKQIFVWNVGAKMQCSDSRSELIKAFCFLEWSLSEWISSHVWHNTNIDLGDINLIHEAVEENAAAVQRVIKKRILNEFPAS